MVIGKNITLNPITNTIPVDSVTDWDSGHTYNVGDEAKYNDRVWKSTADDNIGNTPSPTSLKWKYVRPANKVAWNDELPSTVSTSDSDITLIFEGISDAHYIAFGNMIGTELYIKVEEGDNIIVEENIPLIDYDEPQNAWEMEYLWGTKRQLEDYFYNLPNLPSFNAKYTITIKARDNQCQLGFLKIGQKRQFGCTLTNINRETSPIKEKKRIDGILQDVGGDSWIRMDYNIWIQPNEDLYLVYKYFAEMQGKSTIFLGDDTGDKMEFAIWGLLDKNRSSPYDRTIEFSVFSKDAYQ